MPKYYTVEEISAEINISVPVLYKKVKYLGIDTKKITKSVKTKIIKACQSTIDNKVAAKELNNEINSMKLDESESILYDSGSTLEKRLKIAKKEFDDITLNINQCQHIINQLGTMIDSGGNNGTCSQNPAVKTKAELLKRHNDLQKTIQSLENELKLSATQSIKDSPIGEE